MRNAPRPVREYEHRLSICHQYSQYSHQHKNKPDLFQSESFKCAVISGVRAVTALITCNLARAVPDLTRPIKSSEINKGVAIIFRKSLLRKSLIKSLNLADGIAVGSVHRTKSLPTCAVSCSRTI